MKLQESGEMYLETILVLRQRNGNVRAIDIANEMSFSKPSVSRAMKNLKADGYIDIDDKGLITLTNVGQKYADEIYQRHNVIKNMLMSLEVEEKIAEEDACRIEHVISEDSFKAMLQHSKKH